MPISIDTDQYESLVGLARLGATTAEAQRQVTDLLLAIEQQNGITRYCLWVQWQEGGKQLPATVRFPDRWPPELRCSLERTDRALALADVTKVLATRATKPVSILVTTDPGAVLGWTPIADYFKG